MTDLKNLPAVVEQIIKDIDQHLQETHGRVATAVHVSLEDATTKKTNHLAASWVSWVGRPPSEVPDPAHRQIGGQEEAAEAFRQWKPGLRSGHVNNAPYVKVEEGRKRFIVPAIRRGLQSVDDE